MEKTVDVCVVGAAGGGLSAAITARQNGAKEVLILEKQNHPGGCTLMSAGMMGIDTPVQRRQGMNYSADDAYKELMQVFNWDCDAVLVRKWISGTGKNFEWLEDLGLKYDLAVTEMPDPHKFRNTLHRLASYDGKVWHMEPQGKRLTKTLVDGCERYGIEIKINTRAKELIKDNEGKVCGVKAETKDGEDVTVHAKAVILATGSISANQDLINRFTKTKSR